MQIILEKYCAVMEGTLSNTHKFHTVCSSWHCTEVQNYDELLFSIRTSVPNFGCIIHFFFPLERSMQPGLAETAQALQEN